MTDAERAVLRATPGLVFAIDQTATHDGPGLRMTVYLKGCPLRCVWCHSPESQLAKPEIVWYANRCLSCGACVDECPEGLRTFDPAARPDTSSCRLCEACVGVCPADALEVKGETMTAGEVVDQAVRQKPFFDSSSGGVTITGGEPTLQPDFVGAGLRLLGEQGIHRAVETCGLAQWWTYAALLPEVDLFLYDVKHADDALHRRDTGVSNAKILDNLQRLIAAGADVLVRVPCIPERNDSPEIIASIAQTVVERGVTRISLLPYNPAAPGKYHWLQRDYPLAGLKPQSAERMAELQGLASDAGLEVLPP